MLTETIFLIALLVATLLCTLVAGFVLLFAIVVMPGIGTLSNREFLRAFQVIDKVIQNNQPLFILVWVGSALALIAAAVLGAWQLEGIGQILLVAAAIVFIVGVQLPTININIPLNNRVQTLSLDTLDEESLSVERQNFEPHWNRWNRIRTIFACVASAILQIVVGLV